MAKPDVLPTILGVVAAVLFVTCIILTLIICRRRLKNRERMYSRNNPLSVLEPRTGTTYQENVQDSNKGSYYNFGQVIDSTKVDASIIGIEVETSVVPYDYYQSNNGGNNNNNNDDPSCNNGQRDLTAAAIIGNGSGSRTSFNAKPQENYDTRTGILSQAHSTVTTECGGFQNILRVGEKNLEPEIANMHPDESVVPSFQKRESSAYF